MSILAYLLLLTAPIALLYLWVVSVSFKAYGDKTKYFPHPVTSLILTRRYVAAAIALVVSAPVASVALQWLRANGGSDYAPAFGYALLFASVANCALGSIKVWLMSSSYGLPVKAVRYSLALLVCATALGSGLGAFSTAGYLTGGIDTPERAARAAKWIVYGLTGFGFVASLASVISYLAERRTRRSASRGDEWPSHIALPMVRAIEEETEAPAWTALTSLVAVIGATLLIGSGVKAAGFDIVGMDDAVKARIAEVAGLISVTGLVASGILSVDVLAGLRSVADVLKTHRFELKPRTAPTRITSEEAVRKMGFASLVAILLAAPTIAMPTVLGASLATVPGASAATHLFEVLSAGAGLISIEYAPLTRAARSLGRQIVMGFIEFTQVAAFVLGLIALVFGVDLAPPTAIGVVSVFPGLAWLVVRLSHRPSTPGLTEPTKPPSVHRVETIPVAPDVSARVDGHLVSRQRDQG